MRLQGYRPLLKRAVSKFFACWFSADPKAWRLATSHAISSSRTTPLSSHLGILSRASLVKSRKESRSIIYSVDLEGTRELLSFLVEDCCRGKREICQPLIASALAGVLRKPPTVEEQEIRDSVHLTQSKPSLRGWRITRSIPSHHSPSLRGCGAVNF